MHRQIKDKKKKTFVHRVYKSYIYARTHARTYVISSRYSPFTDRPLNGITPPRCDVLNECLIFVTKQVIRALDRNLSACPAFENIALYQDIQERPIGGVEVIRFADVNYRIIYLLVSSLIRCPFEWLCFWCCSAALVQCVLYRISSTTTPFFILSLRPLWTNLYLKMTWQN